MRLAGHSFWVRVLAVGAHVHVIIIVLLLQLRPPLLPDQRVYIILVLRVVLEERLGGRRLRLIMVGAYIPTDIFALIKIIIMYAFLHWLVSSHMDGRTHDHSSSARLIRIIENISISDILGMNASSSFDHW